MMVVNSDEVLSDYNMEQMLMPLPSCPSSFYLEFSEVTSLVFFLFADG